MANVAVLQAQQTEDARNHEGDEHGFERRIQAPREPLHAKFEHRWRLREISELGFQISYFLPRSDFF
jgi:hypothetical protein